MKSHGAALLMEQGRQALVPSLFLRSSAVDSGLNANQREVHDINIDVSIKRQIGKNRIRGFHECRLNGPVALRLRCLIYAAQSKSEAVFS